ncbi:hypothetical protein ACFLSJ_09015 [Verrucomicrobiota bacterium]
MRARTIAGGIAAALCAASVLAAPIVMHDGDGNPFANWAGEDQFTHAPPSYGDESTQAYGGTFGNALRLDNLVNGGQAIPPTDYFFTTDGPFTGDWNNVNGSGNEARSIRFDFNGGSGTQYQAPPAALALYFYDSATGYTWWYYLNVTTGWQHFEINLEPGPDGLGDFGGVGNWFEIGGNNSLAAWNSAFGSVDEVGIMLQWNAGFPTANYDNQIFWIDNFSIDDSYIVPEPETYAMLACVFLSLAVMFRRRLNELAPQLASVLRS